MAGRLENLLRAMIDDPEVTRALLDLARRLRDSARLAQELEESIAAGAGPARLTDRLRAVNDSCKSCHAQHRDTKSVSR